MSAREKKKTSVCVCVSWCEVHSTQTCLFLWDYKHSQEVVVHSSVDINTMNMLASYLHIPQYAHMDLRLCKQTLELLVNVMYTQPNISKRQLFL